MKEISTLFSWRTLCSWTRFCGAGGGTVSAQIDAWEEPERCDTKFPMPVDWSDVNGNSCDVYDYVDSNLCGGQQWILQSQESSVPMKYVAAAVQLMTAILLLVILRAAVWLQVLAVVLVPPHLINQVLVSNQAPLLLLSTDTKLIWQYPSAPSIHIHRLTLVTCG